MRDLDNVRPEPDAPEPSDTQPGDAMPAGTDPADDADARRAVGARAVDAMRASGLLSPAVSAAFASLTPEEAAGNAEGASPDVWEPVMPAAHESPALADLPRWKGVPASASWTYRDAEGRTLCAVIRYEVERDGRREKETVPYAYGRRVWTDKKASGAT